jgi:hypothetical protein
MNTIWHTVSEDLTITFTGTNKIKKVFGIVKFVSHQIMAMPTYHMFMVILRKLKEYSLFLSVTLI